MNDDERLWAPWRLGYIKGTESADPPPTPSDWVPQADHRCFLCLAAATYAEADADQRLLVAARDEHVVTVLNRYPYSNCHVLVSPRRHVATLAELSDEEHLAAMRVLTRLSTTLTQRIGAQGFNIGLNLGGVAGAGVPGHLHWHLVPRWPGDHNFMPTLAGVRVIPQSLDAAWELVRDALR
ncbi:AP-4-A phosphorylase [Botrimarina colliarenosi]|uniref:AP-4-A phosphorylase n=1 Tax=Botrimarina colliarenosi TaxID=2528001 RepID=A0A5C6ALJ8_9BACT|nr:HIT domain-containing protein [Botrimarina colliarenosi]TWU00510.1 AP-4-A phosphorylase [Botrimarina colliarenosi]